MRMLEELMEKGASGMTDLPKVRQAMANLEVFCIDNVAEYLYAQTDQEEWDVKRDFPCLAPPFPEFWMEFARPSKIVSCLRGVLSSDGLPYRVGLWFLSYTPDEMRENMASRGEIPAREHAQEQLQLMTRYLNQHWTPEVERELEDFRRAQGDKGIFEDEKAVERLSGPTQTVLLYLRQYAATRELLKPGVAALQVERLCEMKVRWVMECHGFVQLLRHGPIFGPLTRNFLYLDADGNVVDHVCTYHCSVNTPEERNAFSTLWFTGLLAISFCHCKNVTLRAESKSPALQKRQAKRGHDLPTFTFKTLEIAPLKTVLRQAGAEDRQTGLKRALHICRGHFANYAEKGLFGKYPGRFWIAQHLRGSREAGMVVKDYAVMPGRGK